MKVFVVTYDHPNYGQGVEGVFYDLDEAKKAVADGFARDGYTTEEWECEWTGDGDFGYRGMGNADGIYYAIYTTDVQ